MDTEDGEALDFVELGRGANQVAELRDNAHLEPVLLALAQQFRYQPAVPRGEMADNDPVHLELLELFAEAGVTELPEHRKRHGRRRATVGLDLADGLEVIFAMLMRIFLIKAGAAASSTPRKTTRSGPTNSAHRWKTAALVDITSTAEATPKTRISS